VDRGGLLTQKRASRRERGDQNRTSGQVNWMKRLRFSLTVQIRGTEVVKARPSGTPEYNTLGEILIARVVTRTGNEELRRRRMHIDRITHNPAVMGGKPCIRGLRVTVGAILGLLASGKSRTHFARLPLPGAGRP
jgi:Protein of unknown function (DUF433)